MNAKVKASELYNEIKFEVEYNSQPSTVHGMCKKLALVLVREMLTQLNKLESTDLSDLQFWVEVEYELNEMQLFFIYIVVKSF